MFSTLLPHAHTYARAHASFQPLLFSSRGEWDLKLYLPILMWDEELRGGKSYSSLCNHSLRYWSVQGRPAGLKIGYCVISATSFWISRLAAPSPALSDQYFLWTPTEKDGGQRLLPPEKGLLISDFSPVQGLGISADRGDRRDNCSHVAPATLTSKRQDMTLSVRPSSDKCPSKTRK